MTPRGRTRVGPAARISGRRLDAAAAAGARADPGGPHRAGSSRWTPARHGADLHARQPARHGSAQLDLPARTGRSTRLDDYLDWVRSVAGKDDPQFHAIVAAGSDPKSGSDPVAVGVASYLRIDPEAGSIEVGHINYSPRLQRTVAATEAMYLMMRRVFELGYRRYEWKCNALNAPSRAAAQRLGFSYEGHLPPGARGQGAQPRHRVVRDDRSRVAGDRPRRSSAGSTRPISTREGRQRTSLRDLTGPILVSRG